MGRRGLGRGLYVVGKALAPVGIHRIFDTCLDFIVVLLAYLEILPGHQLAEDVHGDSVKGVLGVVGADLLVGLLDSTHAGVRHGAIRAPYLIYVYVFRTRNLSGEIIVQGCDQRRLRLHASVGGEAQAHILVGEVDFQFFQLRVRLAVVHVGIDRAFDVEAGPVPHFGKASRSGKTVIAEILPARIAVTLAPVPAYIEGSALLQGKALPYVGQLGVGIHLRFELPRGAPGFGLHYHHAGRKVAVFGGRDSADDLHGLHDARADGAEVGSAAGRGLVAHAVGLGPGGRSVTGGGDGLQVGIVAEGRAVDYDGGTQGGPRAGFYLPDRSLR